ncbi:DUF2975 domain-containing protein [Niabella drilacis]|nr:DUF2975 domain-containing protein [Niabella drilacis]
MSAIIAPVAPAKTNCQVCREQEDSLKRVEELKNGKFQRDIGAPFGQLVRGSFYTDTEIRRYKGYEYPDKEPDYFFALPYWDLASADRKRGTVIYSVENKQAHINVFDYTQSKWGTRKNKPVSFKYDPGKKEILIPVSRSQYKMIRVLIIIVDIFIILLPYLFVMVGGIAGFLLSVAKGAVFTRKNIRRLKGIALVSLIVPLLILVINYSYRFIFHAYFNEYIEFKTELFYDQARNFGIAIICFSLYKAFEKGFRLQQENDLTV